MNNVKVFRSGLDITNQCKIEDGVITIPDETPSPAKTADVNFNKQVLNPYPTGSQSYTAWEKGFLQGIEYAQQSEGCSREDIDQCPNCCSADLSYNKNGSFQKCNECGFTHH